MTVSGKATASVNGRTIAETDTWEVVEGNVYFPPESIKREFFTPSALTTVCPWKGTASYYNVVVDGDELASAAWYYPVVKEAAKEIGGHVAFCEFIYCFFPIQLREWGCVMVMADARAQTRIRSMSRQWPPRWTHRLAGAGPEM